MQKMLIRVLSLVMLGALITSCGNDQQGNDKEQLISQSCGYLEKAWRIRDFYTPKYMAMKAENYTKAGSYFRELAAIDSGFIPFASVIQKDGSISNFTKFYEMIDFCGLG